MNVSSQQGKPTLFVLRWHFSCPSFVYPIKANLQYISQKWHVPLQTVKTGNCKLNFQKDTVNIQRTGAIFDFLEIRDNDELSEILNFLCTY